MALHPWTLTIGGEDLSPFLLPSARFTEIASSTDGIATFSLNGAHDVVRVGASCVLSRNGTNLWEGTISQANQSGNAMSVTALPLASQMDVAANAVVTTPIDVAQVASLLCGLSSVPWGGPALLGDAVGSLSFTNLGSGLSVAARLSGRTWRVENGQVVFRGAQDGISSVDLALSATSIAGVSVEVWGGLDIGTQKNLHAVYATVGSAYGPAYVVVIPEIADAITLDAMGTVLATHYGDGSIQAMTAFPSGSQLRAGDWFSDQNGVVTVAWSVLNTMAQGDIQQTVTSGFPQPSVSTHLIPHPNDMRRVVGVNGDYTGGSVQGRTTGWGLTGWGLKGWGM